MAKQIVNGVEYSNEFDPQIYAKIGTSQLETQADNLSDAVNELKQGLSDLGSGAFLGRTQNTITTIAQSVALSEAFRNYLLVNIELRESSNVVATLTLTTEYIDITTSSSCPKLYFNGNYVEVYKVDSTHLGVKGNTIFGASYNTAIRGLIKIANN